MPPHKTHFHFFCKRTTQPEKKMKECFPQRFIPIHSEISVTVYLLCELMKQNFVYFQHLKISGQPK